MVDEDHLEPLPDEDALAARGRLLVAHAVGATAAPLALRERIERDRAAARPAAASQRRLRPFALAAGALAALVAVALLVSGGLGGGSGQQSPSVLLVAKVA